MPQDTKYTETELRLMFEECMVAMQQTLKEAKEPNQRIYAGSNLAGLIKEYRKTFGVDERQSNMRSVKNF